MGSESSHAAERPIRDTLQQGLDAGESADALMKRVMGELSNLGMVMYAPKDSIRLLTPSGRVLVALMERPGVTMREMAVYLGVTEAAVMRCISTLVKGNVIARTKVKGQNHYRFNLKDGSLPPDITRLYAAFSNLINNP